jgi:hypothetical protein
VTISTSVKTIGPGDPHVLQDAEIGAVDGQRTFNEVVRLFVTHAVIPLIGVTVKISRAAQEFGHLHKVSYTLAYERQRRRIAPRELSRNSPHPLLTPPMPPGILPPLFLPRLSLLGRATAPPVSVLQPEKVVTAQPDRADPDPAGDARHRLA